MTTILLAGGGTAGHVNPMLAVADALQATIPGVQIVIVGTAEGLESRLVPERGYQLNTIPKVPFPRRPNRAALRFWPQLRRAQRRVEELIREHHVDVVAGFGGYVSTPVYLAARRAQVPIVVHEANAKPGLANRLGARLTNAVGVAFPGTPLANGQVVGMPLRREVEAIAQSTETRAAMRAEACVEFALDPKRPTLLVTGGSLGARRINETIRATASTILDSGWNILHLVGGTPEIDDPGIDGYRQLRYLDRMELALALADVAVSRAGSSTVSELTAMAVPTVYIPYAVGNGEQRLNAAAVVNAGGAVLVEDREFPPEWVTQRLLPLLANANLRAEMRTAAAGVGVVDGTARTVSLIQSVLA
ncbi:MAG: UDP-N-acetylglucosamine--N-acetylmuramyl-(pentapeptide) pyrophosphoryl-undecaprenol N-acetylglucosamine transferase [Agromyces sp.]